MANFWSPKLSISKRPYWGLISCEIQTSQKVHGKKLLQAKVVTKRLKHPVYSRVLPAARAGEPAGGGGGVGRFFWAKREGEGVFILNSRGREPEAPPVAHVW